jgi:hypothetical protein
VPIRRTPYPIVAEGHFRDGRGHGQHFGLMASVRVSVVSRVLHHPSKPATWQVCPTDLGEISAERVDEDSGVDSSLTKDPYERSSLHLAEQGHNTGIRPLAHHHMTPPLANGTKSEMLESADHFGAGDDWDFRQRQRRE